MKYRSSGNRIGVYGAAKLMFSYSKIKNHTKCSYRLKYDDSKAILLIFSTCHISLWMNNI